MPPLLVQKFHPFATARGVYSPFSGFSEVSNLNMAGFFLQRGLEFGIIHTYTTVEFDIKMIRAL